MDVEYSKNYFGNFKILLREKHLKFQNIGCKNTS